LATKEAGVYSNDSRVIAQEDIDRVVEHRKQMVNTLRAHPCFDISTDGKELICHFCVKNWEKAKLNFSEDVGRSKYLALSEHTLIDTSSLRSILCVVGQKTHSRSIRSTTMIMIFIPAV